MNVTSKHSWEYLQTLGYKSHCGSFGPNTKHWDDERSPEEGSAQPVVSGRCPFDRVISIRATLLSLEGVEWLLFTSSILSACVGKSHGGKAIGSEKTAGNVSAFGGMASRKLVGKEAKLLKISIFGRAASHSQTPRGTRGCFQRLQALPCEVVCWAWKIREGAFRMKGQNLYPRHMELLVHRFKWCK